MLKLNMHELHIPDLIELKTLYWSVVSNYIGDAGFLLNKVVIQYKVVRFICLKLKFSHH